MEEFEKAYSSFERTWDLTELLPAYQDFLLNRDRPVRVLDPKGEYQGIARGITAGGELLVEREQGDIVKVYAGEVSVRGAYGYV